LTLKCGIQEAAAFAELLEDNLQLAEIVCAQGLPAHRLARRRCGGTRRRPTRHGQHVHGLLGALFLLLVAIVLLDVGGGRRQQTE
jgi:hypothetical protein